MSDRIAHGVVPADAELLTIACAVGATALISSMSRITRAASPGWALGALLLDLVSAVVLVCAIRRVSALPAATRTLERATTFRIEQRAAQPTRAKRYALLATTAVGTYVLWSFATATGRPDHWIVALAVLAVAASASPLLALPVLTLTVDVELRRIVSSLGAFELERGASLSVIDSRAETGAHTLVVRDRRRAPRVVASNVDRDQLTDVARSVAELLGDVVIVG